MNDAAIGTNSGQVAMRREANSARVWRSPALRPSAYTNITKPHENGSVILRNKSKEKPNILIQADAHSV